MYVNLSAEELDLLVDALDNILDCDDEDHPDLLPELRAKLVGTCR